MVCHVPYLVATQETSLQFRRKTIDASTPEHGGCFCYDGHIEIFWVAGPRLLVECDRCWRTTLTLARCYLKLWAILTDRRRHNVSYFLQSEIQQVITTLSDRMAIVPLGYFKKVRES